MQHIIDKNIRLNNQSDYLARLNDLVRKTYNPPSFGLDKGIIYCAGGVEYFKCAFASAYALRKLGCNLPIQFWHIGDNEINAEMRQLCSNYNIECVNAVNVCKHNGLGINFFGQKAHKKFEIKPLSILFTNIRQVLFIDADNIPVKDPTYLYDDNRYKEHGSIFWPDFDNRDGKYLEWLPERSWKAFGMNHRKELDFETGQILVDKSKCYKELCITLWVNMHSKFFYNYMHGDKSSFHLVWRKCNKNYYINNKPPGWKWQCLLQYDPDNNLIFQHACHGKKQICDGNVPAEIVNHQLINEAAKVRSEIWNGKL